MKFSTTQNTFCSGWIKKNVPRTDKRYGREWLARQLEDDKKPAKFPGWRYNNKVFNFIWNLTIGEDILRYCFWDLNLAPQELQTTGTVYVVRGLFIMFIQIFISYVNNNVLYHLKTSNILNSWNVLQIQDFFILKLFL